MNLHSVTIEKKHLDIYLLEIIKGRDRATYISKKSIESMVTVNTGYDYDHITFYLRSNREVSIYVNTDSYVDIHEWLTT
jgi:hypothetical protein